MNTVFVHFFRLSLQDSYRFQGVWKEPEGALEEARKCSDNMERDSDMMPLPPIGFSGLRRWANNDMTELVQEIELK